MSLTTTQFDRTNPVTGKTDPDGTCFVAEASELGYRAGQYPPRSFVLNDCPMPGMMRCFRQSGVDEFDGDIKGWRYMEEAGPNKGNTSYKEPASPKPCQPFTVLIIND